ncbi:MAG: C-terminal binding protein [Gammaproteobacteria bacterium]|nr:C-terminal binding protein [Gammaproteobacteria bacterium]
MSKKKVVVQLPRIPPAQNIAKRYAFELEALDAVAEIVEVEAASVEEFITLARDADAVITSWGIKIDQAIIDGLTKCVVIGVGSVGVDMVDVEAATRAGIVVTNVPDVFIEEVADHAMMLLLSTTRRTKQMDQMVRDGDWFKGRPLLSDTPRLLGQTLGLVAFGNVARCMAKRAGGFGMHVIAHDPYVSELTISESGVEPVGWQELLERSDYLSIHTPLNEETHHLLNGEALAQMKSTAVVINTARGPVIDEAHLIQALADHVIAGAGLDVLEQEPPASDNPLLAMANVVVTPHVASATNRMRPETRRRVGREVALVLRNRWPMSCVNPTVLPRVALDRWQPYPMNRGPNR